MKGVKYMKVLKIDKGNALYTIDKITYKPIIDIEKEDLYKVLQLVLSETNLEIDLEDDSTFKINNEAERVIYKDLREKLTVFHQQRQTLLNEVDTLYKDSIEKYKMDL
jgi:hypothetical protein